MELNNFYKRFITAVFGVFFIALGILYLPEIKILIFESSFRIHLLIIILIIIFILEIFFQLKRNRFSRNFSLFLYLFIYLLFFLHIIFLQNIFENWKHIFFYILSLIFIIDIFGYLSGKIFGKTKIGFINNISPNKTLEGYIGSISAGAIWGLISLLIFNNILDINLSTKILLIFSVIFASILGDLYVSKIKRTIKVKDFSNILYGHGGISDRLDSVLPSFAISFWILFLL